MAADVFFVGPWERVLYLRTVPALRGLPSGELVRVAQFARERSFPAGTFLFEPGSRAEAFHVVVEGRVRVRRESREAQIIGPRDVVGFLHLLARRAAGLEAQAETRVLTLEFDADVQMDLCEERFSVLLNYARFLSRSLIAAESGSSSAVDPPPALPSATAHAERPELVERILALHGSETFRDCGLDAVAELARHVGDAGHPAGATVWREGDPSDGFLLLRSGLLEEPHRRFFVPGQVAGLEEALAGEPRRALLLAREDSAALRVDLEPFLDILEDHFETAMALLCSMADRLLELLDRAARPRPQP